VWFVIVWRSLDVHSDPLAGALDAVVMAQIGLLAAWVSLGPAQPLLPWPVRLIAFIACVEMLRQFAGAENYFDARTALFVTLAVGSLLATVGLRLTGLKVALVGPGFRAVSVQFSLFGLVALIGVSGVAIQAALVMRSAVKVAGELPTSIAMLVVAVAHTATLIVVLVCMRLHRVWLALPVALALCAAIGSLVPLVCNQDQDVLRFNGWMLVDGAAMAGSLLMLRMSGYRLIGPQALAHGGKP
jgi:hypothetical protein